MNIHIDLNTGEQVTLSNFKELNFGIDELTGIIATTLSEVNKKSAFSNKNIVVSIYLVAEDEGKTLNHDYRNKNYATNVLSFPADFSDLPSEILAEMPEHTLGELIICLPVVLTEAKTQHKSPQSHFTHLLVHGCLHLLGFDHELSATVTPTDAEEMEAIEIAVLKKLEISNPYL